LPPLISITGDRLNSPRNFGVAGAISLYSYHFRLSSVCAVMRRGGAYLMTKFIGSIDQGTTSSRFIIFDRNGDIVAMDQREHEQIYPKAGWVEHNANEIWRNTQHVIGETLKKAKLKASGIASVGITNQRETTLLWDRKTG